MKTHITQPLVLGLVASASLLLPELAFAQALGGGPGIGTANTIVNWISAILAILSIAAISFVGVKWWRGQWDFNHAAAVATGVAIVGLAPALVTFFRSGS
ncbi:MAG: TrbC/VirB2 family protein [Burkholderiales bacterium]